MSFVFDGENMIVSPESAHWLNDGIELLGAITALSENLVRTTAVTDANKDTIERQPDKHLTR